MPREINITIDEARALVADRALWPLVRDFLWDFAPQVHGSWLEGLGREGESASSHVSSLMSSPRVKRFVLSELGVAPCFHAFPKEDWSRLVLLDGATLESIAKWLGALACADSLRRVTGGATVRELKATLPGIYPEVFAFTEYFGKWKIENVECKMEGSTICKLGGQVLFAVLKDLPEAVLRRLELKLPKDIQVRDVESFGNFSFSIFNSQFIAKLLKLRFPEAYKICCL